MICPQICYDFFLLYSWSSIHTFSDEYSHVYQSDSNRRKPVNEICTCTTFRHGLLTGIRGIYGLRSSVELRAGPTACRRSPTGYWNFGPYGARRLPRESMRPRHDIGIRYTDAWTGQMSKSPDIIKYRTIFETRCICQVWITGTRYKYVA